ncbi:MAG: hypothetical protein ABII97_02705 [Patescibacteria group bacterium]
MKWIKQGLIFKPENYNFPWINSYAWVPSIECVKDNLFKVYFGGRDKENYTQTGYFIFNITNPKKILHVSPNPIISLGPLGSFDDSLALACSLVKKGNIKYLYYVGWMSAGKVRYYPSIGLAISCDFGQTFHKLSKAPLLARDNEEPFGMASPFVMRDNEVWKMWYASYRWWETRNNEPWPHYEIRYAESRNGINWTRFNTTCLGSDHEEAIARPWVMKENGIYKMWYCYRKNYDTYRMGYAESNNGVDWKRMDEKVGIDVSLHGWDSEMIEYPCIFDHRNDRYMLYNGNNHGQTGIGLAKLSKEV